MTLFQIALTLMPISHDLISACTDGEACGEDEFCCDWATMSVCVGELLTLFCLVDFSILISWTSLFPNLGVSGVFFLLLFYMIFNRNSCKQCRS